ncbi:MAG: DUF1501 domain-containing protein [Planctomycetaceae bacterium]
MTTDLSLFSRRELLQSASAGFGYLAFAGLATQAAEAESGNPLSPRQPHFPAKARRVIFLCMQGGPSHVDTFDYKPQLAKDAGKGGKYGGSCLMASPWEFRQHGKSGLWISDLFPELSKHADELCLIRSMHCDQPTHPRAMTQMHTGNAQFVRPSLGAWTLYGLGTENDSMPGFVALNPPAASAQNFGSAFLPAIYQGTKVGRPQARGSAGNRGNNAGPSLADISNPRISSGAQRRQLDFIQKLNQQKLRREQYQPGVEGVIESYELAFRMQDVLPDLMDISEESEKTLGMYGIDGSDTDAFGRQCLMARRFVEAGVRFVEITHGNWDHHNRLRTDFPERCTEIDKPIAGLLKDLAQRGLLKDTLVIWGGEFGRTPDAPNGDGRDHNHKGYTTWMAGGGVKGGMSYGSTDDHGYAAVENKCHIHDWHATILHLLGLDHTRLTYRYAGRDFRMTDVYGNVVQEILA